MNPTFGDGLVTVRELRPLMADSLERAGYVRAHLGQVEVQV